jgi:hypothetical protein
MLISSKILPALFPRWGHTPVLTEPEQIERMLVARERIEKETEDAIAAFRKKAENESWMKTGQAMLEIGAGEYTCGAVEKAWLKEKKSGFPHRASIDAVMSRSTMVGTVVDGTLMGSTVKDGFDVDNGGTEDRGGPVREESS